MAFECLDRCGPSALDGALPDGVLAWASADVPGDFHATRDARRRAYVYHLHAPGADDARLRAAAGRLAGEHDFHNLTPDDRNTVREVAIDLSRDGDFVVVAVAAGGFPRQLVRRLVSLLADVGSGRRPPESVDRVLAAAELPGHEGVPPAPAFPLVLASVEYDVDFAVDDATAASVRNWFVALAARHAARARVARSVRDGV